MATVDQINKSATAIAQALIAADAKITMAGMKPPEMKEHASTVINGALPTVLGCVDAMAKDPKNFENADPDTIGVLAVALAAFGTKTGNLAK
ncbi:unnamed protein product [Discula destructiva]